MADGKSEQVQIARAGERQAYAEVVRANAQRFPLFFGAASYTRTLASEFAGIFDRGNGQACAPLAVNPAAPLDQRVAEVERFLGCGGTAFNFDNNGSSLPFGRTNIWNLGLSFAQPVYTGGRIGAQERQAEAARRSAHIDVTSTNAQVLLAVTQSFYDAALADDLVEIARATIAQAEQTLEFARLRYKVGELPEFEVLRAQVARTNLAPNLTRAIVLRDENYLRLRQLIDLPAAASLRLRAGLASDPLPVPAPFAEELAKARPLQESEFRAPVRQSETQVLQREEAITIARSQRLPYISVDSRYGLVAYPGTFFPVAANQFRNNWTLGASLQIPILDFGRIRADELSARAGLEQARVGRRLASELALLDSSISVYQLQAALDDWRASAGNIEQAERAYQIAETRYREGVSNLLELNDARLALQQARVNRVEAARNLQVSRARVALLPLLPLDVSQTGLVVRTILAPAQPSPVLRQPALQVPLVTQPITGGQNVQFPGTTTGVPQP